MNTLDLKKIFESLPDNYLIIKPELPNFTIVAVTDAFLATTRTSRDDLIGKDVFEAFPVGAK